MSRIKAKFESLETAGRAALIAYICAGDPDLDTTERMVLEIEKSGADIIELGIPFSDPIADGPTIQRSAQRALAKGVRLIDIMDLVRKLRKKTQIPIVFMGYFNPFFHFGLEKFVNRAVECGVDGLIIPDLPPDEADELIQFAHPAGLDTIFLLAPTSTEARIKYVTGKTTGFVYYVSLTGVTGARDKIQVGVESALTRIRKHTKLPICVGFGVSTPKQVQQLTDWGANGVIVGSAIVSRIEKDNCSPELVKNIGIFISELSKGLIHNTGTLQPMGIKEN